MKIDEQSQKYEIEFDFAYFDNSGYLTPVGYQTIVNYVADKHLLNHGMNFERLVPLGISWVILSLTLDIVNPIKDREKKFYGRTWYSQRKGIYYRREVTVEDENGAVMFNCATYSTLLDLNTRSIYKSRILPFELMEPTEQLLVEAKPSFKEKLQYTQGEKRIVHRSYLDGLGHVNNGKYSTFCYDAFDDNEANLENMRRMELYFATEMRFGDYFSSNKATYENRLIVQGYNESKEKPSFYGVFGYAD